MRNGRRAWQWRRVKYPAGGMRGRRTEGAEKQKHMKRIHGCGDGTDHLVLTRCSPFSGKILPVDLAQQASPDAVYAGEDNLTQAGVDQTTLGGYTVEQATEAYDEPLTMDAVAGPNGIAAPFFAS